MGETISYYPYFQPVHPDIVQFGHLAFRYRNPQNPPKYRHDETIPGLDNMTVTDKRPAVLLSHRENRNTGFSGGLESILELSRDASVQKEGFVIGKDGSQIELKDPEVFFDNVILKSEKARNFLKSRLAVVNKLRLLRNYLGKAPELWMLTGVLVIKEAAHFTVASTSQNASVNASVPIPEPTGFAALMGLKAGAKASIGRGITVVCGTWLTTPMIWAAKWQRVGVKYILESRVEDELSKALKLLDIVSSLGTRGDDDDEDVYVDMSVTNDMPALSGEEDYEGLPEQYWERFEEEVDALEEEDEDPDEE